MRKYFDQNEFRKALSYQNTNIHKCVQAFETYLSKYPLDYNAYIHYIYELITVRDLKKAEEMLDLVEYMYFCDGRFGDPKKRKILEMSILSAKVKLLMYEERYRECYNLIKENQDFIKENDKHLSMPFLECKKQLGYKVYKTIVEKDTYAIDQLINYDENLFFWKMREHLDDSDMDLKDKCDNRFNKDFPFEKVYRLLRTYPNYKNRLFLGYIEDINYYRYDNCGIVDGYKSNYFKAVSFHGTTDFITIYPVRDIEDMNAVNLNHLKGKQKTIVYIPDNK